MGISLIGKNKNFIVVYNTQQQTYDVYYKKKFLITKERYIDIQSYLN